MIQCIVKNKLLMEKISELTLESVVEVKGKVRKAKVKAEHARKDVEVEVFSLKILNRAEQLPIQVNEKTVKSNLSNKLDWRCLSLRNPKSQIIFKIQSKLIEGMQEYLNRAGFLQIFTPCLMGVASESGSEVFEVKYFEGKSFLRQDPQLHRQLTIAGGMEKIYDIGPSWRAEKSNTVRHLCEHRTCAVEMAFIENEKDIMRIEEQVIISAFKKINKDCKKELELLGIKLKIPKTPFPEIEFPEVYDILRKVGRKIKIGDDLDLESERALWDYVQKKYPRCEFYFLNKFPFKKKPFYVYCEQGERYARSTDLFYKGTEISSGGQREHRYNFLMENIKDKKISLKSIEWFTKFFKCGVPPHGGFALGIERITMVLLRLQNIREATLFPRDKTRLMP